MRKINKKRNYEQEGSLVRSLIVVIIEELVMMFYSITMSSDFENLCQSL